MAGGPNADEAKARLYAEKSLAHFDWLCAQGVQYKTSYIPDKIVEPVTDDCLIWSGSEEAWPFANVAKPCPRGHCPQFAGMGGGRYLMDVLAKRVHELNIDVRYNTRALALIADDAGRVDGLRECGWAAADSLRIESGYVLFDREIDGRANPSELGLERLAGKSFEVRKKLVGLEILDGPAPARLPAAEVTSECVSPTLGRPIALGYAGAEISAGNAVRLADGRLARVARLPFYDPEHRRPRAVPIRG